MHVSLDGCSATPVPRQRRKKRHLERAKIVHARRGASKSTFARWGPDCPAGKPQRWHAPCLIGSRQPTAAIPTAALALSGFSSSTGPSEPWATPITSASLGDFFRSLAMTPRMMSVVLTTRMFPHFSLHCMAGPHVWRACPGTRPTSCSDDGLGLQVKRRKRTSARFDRSLSQAAGSN